MQISWDGQERMWGASCVEKEVPRQVIQLNIYRSNDVFNPGIPGVPYSQIQMAQIIDGEPLFSISSEVGPSEQQPINGGIAKLVEFVAPTIFYVLIEVSLGWWFPTNSISVTAVMWTRIILWNRYTIYTWGYQPEKEVGMMQVWTPHVLFLTCQMRANPSSLSFIFLAPSSSERRML